MGCKVCKARSMALVDDEFEADADADDPCVPLPRAVRPCLATVAMVVAIAIFKAMNGRSD